MPWVLFLTIVAQVLVSAVVLYVLAGLAWTAVSNVRRKPEPSEDREAR